MELVAIIAMIALTLRQQTSEEARATTTSAVDTFRGNKRRKSRNSEKLISCELLEAVRYVTKSDEVDGDNSIPVQ